ncbi:unnamed protein product [Arabis nemorensis]|uniref:Ion transport domain-containing protein n=1 Tax=Arabis nemorensis TaxID=586526 RepID=A0A565BCJ7_9BRAS|nr:unnamed protein product [Arabis nemorensis]
MSKERLGLSHRFLPYFFSIPIFWYLLQLHDLHLSRKWLPRTKTIRFPRSSSRTRAFPSRTRSVPLEIDDSSVVLGYAGSPQRQRRPPLVPMAGPISSTRRPEPLLLRSGRLGMCNDPYCTTCPSHYNLNGSQRSTLTVSVDSTFRNALYDGARGRARRFASSVNRCLPRIMNPHSKAVQWWAKFFALSSLVAIFIDPLFFFLMYVQQNDKCIIFDWPNIMGFVTVRTLVDVIFLANILLQFRLAYVARESGQLVDSPKKIALHYLLRYFFLDLFIVLPLPQILIFLVIETHLGTSGVNNSCPIHSKAIQTSTSACWTNTDRLHL